MFLCPVPFLQLIVLNADEEECLKGEMITDVDFLASAAVAAEGAKAKMRHGVDAGAFSRPTTSADASASSRGVSNCEAVKRLGEAKETEDLETSESEGASPPRRKEPGVSRAKRPKESHTSTRGPPGEVIVID